MKYVGGGLLFFICHGCFQCWNNGDISTKQTDHKNQTQFTSFTLSMSPLPSGPPFFLFSPPTELFLSNLIYTAALPSCVISISYLVRAHNSWEEDRLFTHSFFTMALNNNDRLQLLFYYNQAKFYIYQKKPNLLLFCCQIHHKAIGTLFP